jgi:hypothetical protein
MELLLVGDQAMRFATKWGGTAKERMSESQRTKNRRKSLCSLEDLGPEQM